MNGVEYLKEKLAEALQKLDVTGPDVPQIMLERPKVAEHGDLSTNIALLLAKVLKRKPRDIAEEIQKSLTLDVDIVDDVNIAGPGFINFRLGDGYFHNVLGDILSLGKDFGKDTWGNNERIQFEFVSANPTGPLNIVSARAATVGDVLSSILTSVGFEVEREYYVNDAGRQVRLLGMSVSSSYMRLTGQSEPFPEEGYHGDYINDLAKSFFDEHGEKFAQLQQRERWNQLSELALETILSAQKKVLADFGLDFDVWFRERILRQSNDHLNVLNKLTENGHVYEQDGAKWFRATDFGDEKDRVLVTSEGEPTYFLVDIAYHEDKYKRKFSKLYDLWGPDHHGYIQRVKSALTALGHPEDSFEVIIIQQVNLIQDGEVVKMSKRAGKIIEMQELLDEVGVDVARFFFVARRTQSPLDFDLDLAKKTSDENPVYYVQYAHARICNVIKHAESQGVKLPETANFSLLKEEEELNLIKKLLEFPEVVSKAAQYLEAHRVPNYLQEVAATLHRFYHHHKVVTDDVELTKARLLLIQGARVVFTNALNLMGVSAPERM